MFSHIFLDGGRAVYYNWLTSLELCLHFRYMPYLISQCQQTIELTICNLIYPPMNDDKFSEIRQARRDVPILINWLNLFFLSLSPGHAPLHMVIVSVVSQL